MRIWVGITTDRVDLIEFCFFFIYILKKESEEFYWMSHFLHTRHVMKWLKLMARLVWFSVWGCHINFNRVVLKFKYVKIVLN